MNNNKQIIEANNFNQLQSNEGLEQYLEIVKEVNSVILVFFNNEFLAVFIKALFLSTSADPTIFINTGNEKLTKQILQFKESVVITEELQAIEIGQGAESEFLVN